MLDGEETIMIMANGKTIDSSAVWEIMAIRDQIAVMGSNDSEFDCIEQILADFLNGRIDSVEAIKMAKAVLNSKQSYR